MSLWDIFTTPGAELAGATPWGFWPWMNKLLVTAIQVSPEILTVVAMCLLLLGMVGSRKFMGWAGTAILLAFIGVILSAAI